MLTANVWIGLLPEPEVLLFDDDKDIDDKLKNMLKKLKMKEGGGLEWVSQSLGEVKLQTIT